MNLKRIKRKCGVKGCRNTDTYAVSKRDFGNSIIICRACLEETLKAVDNYKETGGKEKRPMTAPPPLFFSTAKAPVAEPAEEADVTEEVSEVVEEGAEPAEEPAEAIEEAVEEAPVEAPAEKKPVKGKGKKGAK